MIFINLASQSVTSTHASQRKLISPEEDMSRQEKRAKERKLRKALRKISLAAGEGVGRAVAFSFVLSSSSTIAAEPEKKKKNLPCRRWS